MRILKAATLYFALVFGTGFVLGMIRVPFLVPRLGVRVAELIEMPFMCVAIVLAARHVVRRFELASVASTRLPVGLIALGITVIAELSLAVLTQDRSIADYVLSRDPVSGPVYLAMLVLFALMPWILARGRGGR